MADSNQPTGGPERESSEERQALCSSCFEVVPESRVHVIPCFNDFLNAYVTSYRCETCWQPSLAQTRARLAAAETLDEVATLGEFFGRDGVIVIEYHRRDPLPAVMEALLRRVDQLGTEELRLSIGPARPLHG